ncbi:MAG TPA: efflux RND transporter permease subunit [Saprospiraceae bacterium]|nr:efflux RND transporter permease subunit [Saprospiraceae bacterium]
MLSIVRNNAFTIVILFVSAALCSFFFIEGLNLELNPRSQAKTIILSGLYPKASPQAIEIRAVTPLEAGMARIRGVNEILSKSGNGHYDITLTLDKKADAEMLRFEVSNRVREIYPSLPPECTYPSIRVSGEEDKTLQQPIMTYSVFSNDAAERVNRYVRESLLPRLSLIPGLLQIDVSGGNEIEWVIEYNTHTMEGLGVQLNELTSVLSVLDSKSGLSSVQYDGENILLMLKENPTIQLSSIPVKSTPHHTITIGDIASIKMLEKEPERMYRIDGKNNIRLNFFPEKGANHMLLASHIREKILDINDELPPGYNVLMERDTTEYLSTELDKIRVRSLLSLSILLLFVLLAYRNWKYLLVVIGSLIVNVALAIIFYNLFDINLNLYALAAITVSFGIIIDNTVVMAHHIRKFDNVRVFPAITTATLTTLASLTIIFFLPEMWKNNLLEFSRVIIINLFLSLVIAITFVPALIHLLSLNPNVVQASPSGKYHKYTLSTFGWINNNRKWVLAFSILLFGLPVYLLPTKVEGWEWYNKTLGSEWYKENLRKHVNRYLGGTSRLFYQYVYESGSFRSNEETILYVRTTLPNGSTIEQMDDLIKNVEHFLHGYKSQVKNYITNILSGENASMTITFVNNDDYVFPHVLKNRLIGMATNMGGAKWSVYGVGKGFSNASGYGTPRYAVTVEGYNLDQLELISDRFGNLLEEHPRVKEVERNANLSWYEKEIFRYTFSADQRSLLESGVKPQELYHKLNTLNPRRTLVSSTGENIPIRVVNQNNEQQSIWNMYNEIVRQDSFQVLMASLGQINKEKMPNTIHKKNQQYIRKMEWEYTGADVFGNKYLQTKLEEFTPTLPLGYEIKRSTYSWNFGKEARKQYGLLVLIIAMIFILSSIHFESLKRGLTIIMLIPISFIGIFLTFYWFDFPFDQGGYTSFILISGITVNSMILILSDFDIAKKLHPDTDHLTLYTDAFFGKMTPVILTVLSTALGLTPFLLYGKNEAFWYALAVGTIGGLLFSLVAVVFIMPAFLPKFSKI